MFSSFPTCWLAVLVITCLTGCRSQDLNSLSSALNESTLDAAARTLLEVLPDSTTTGRFGPDAISIGNYTLIGCGSGADGSPADYLTTLLPTMLDRLRYTLADAELGISGFHGYRTFFQYTNFKETVVKVFQNVKSGSKIHLRTTRADRIETPKIVCLGADEYESHVTGVGNLYEFYCSGHYGLNTPAAQFRKTELVVLCPSFFQLPIWPTIVSCPSVRNLKLWPDGVDLVQSQYAMLMRALAGIYIPATRSTSRNAKPDTPARLRDIVALPAAVAVGDKDSYAYYAASVEAKCSGWPV